jgi:hypothetical protein
MSSETLIEKNQEVIDIQTGTYARNQTSNESGGKEGLNFLLLPVAFILRLRMRCYIFQFSF